MATGVGMGFDLSAALQNAEKIDKKISDMVDNAAKLEQSMTKALSAGGATEILGRLQKNLADFSKTKVDLHFETKEANELLGIMDRIVSMVKITSQGGAVELFDTKKVYETADSVLQVERNLELTTKKIEDIRAEWRKAFVSHELDNFQAPINPKTGKAYTENSKVYKQAREQALAEAQAAAQIRVDTELRALIEAQAIQKKELQWTSMTEDQKAQYIQKRLNEVLKAEQKHTSEVQKEYSRLSSEIIRIYDQIQRTEKSVVKGEKEGVDVSKQKAQLTTLENQLREKLALQQQIEQESGNIILRQIENFWVQVQERDRRGLEDRIKQATEYRKKTKEAQEIYNRTPKGALEKSNNAKSINDEREAIKLLIAARDSLSNSTTNYTQIVETLNKRIQQHRISVEELTTAEKNEQTLQPTVRNEYARLLKELDKLDELRNRAAKHTNLNDPQAVSNYQSIIARYEDVENRIIEIEESAGDKLVETKRKHEAEKAAIAIREAEKEAQETYKIHLRNLAEKQKKRQATRTISSETAEYIIERTNQTTSLNQERKAVELLTQARERLYVVTDSQDHQERIDSLKGMMSGIEEDISRHWEEVERLKAEQEKSLNPSFKTQVLNSISEKDDADVVRENAARQDAIDQRMSAISALEREYRKMSTEVERLESASDGENETLTKLNEAIAKHIHNIKMATDAQYALNASKQEGNEGNDVDNAIDEAKSAKSLREMQNSYKELKRVRLDATDPKDVKRINREMEKLDGRIRRATDSTKRFSSSNRKLADTFGQVQRRAAAFFSVAQITHYVQRLAQVRGEFEMQHKSLQIILNDNAKVEELWSKTLQLALKSPFTTSQLITYTKQLAAYRIETDKLYDTTKMLADVSAGVGVDMQRLILAYGQVRAAEYLRATELRQFTEAGIPLLSELSKMFTEQEGRLISTADVFERITKRMVDFADVEYVFRSLTEEGGRFYQMQEQQSQTLAGQIANLKDAYILMYNDIGEEQEGFLKDSVAFMRELVKNWRDLAPFVSAVVAGLIAGGTVRGISALIKTLGHALNAVKMLATGVKALNAIPVGGWMALVGVVVALGTAIYGVMKNTDELSSKMARIDVEVGKEMSESVDLYKKLADTVKSTTSTYGEQQEALEKLGRVYKDIIPDEYLRIEYINKTKEGYEEATKAIEAYYNAEAIARKKRKLDEKYTEDIDEEVDHVVRQSIWGSTAKTLELTEKQVRTIVTRIVDDVKNGTIKANKVLSEFIRRAYEYKGVPLDEHSKKLMEQYDAGATNITFWDDLIEKLEEYETRYDAITGLPYKTEKEEEAAKTHQQRIDRLNEEEKKLETLRSAWKAYFDATTNKNSTKQDIAGYAQDIKDAYKALNMKAPDNNSIKKIGEDMLLVEKEMKKVGNTFYDNFIKQFEKGDALAKNYAETLQQAKDALNGGQFSSAYLAIIEALGKEFDVESKHVARIIGLAQKSRSEAVKELKALHDDQEELLKSYKMTEATMPKGIAAPSEISNPNLSGWQSMTSAIHGGIDKEESEGISTFVKFLEKLLKILGFVEKKSSRSRKGRNDIVSQYRDMLEIITTLNEDFKKFNEHLDTSAAKQQVVAIYADKVKEIYKKLGWTIDDIDFTSVDGTVKAMEDLLEKAKEVKGLGSFVRDLTIKIAKFKADAGQEDLAKAFEKVQEQVEGLFDDYEIYMELEEMGVPKDFAASLFGLDAMSLEDVKKKLQGLKDAGKFDGKKAGEAYEEYLRKIEKMEQEHLERLLKDYVKYSLETVSERAKIQLKYYRDIERINAATENNPQARASILEGLSKEYSAEMQKNEWDELKETDFFIRLFGDLQNASKSAIEKMISDLEKYKNTWTDLPIDQIEELAKKLEELREAQAQLEAQESPWGAYREARKAIRKDGRTREEAEMDLYDSETRELEYNQQLSDLQAINNLLSQNKDATVLINEYNDKYKAGLTSSTEDVKSRVDFLKEQIKWEEASQRNSNNQINNYKKSKKALEAQADALGNIKKMGNDVYEAYKSLYEALGGDDDNPAAIFAEMGMSMANSVIDCIMLQIQLKAATVAAKGMGAAMNTAMGIVGWIVMAVQVIAQVFTAIATNKDNQIKKKIEETKEEVEKLQKAFEKLEEAIEKAFTVNDLQRQYTDGIANLNEQIQKQEELIALEESRKKKNRDENAIKEAKEEIEELRKQREELLQSTVEDLGGTYDVRGAAREFVDAWVDAFRETGNGLKGLEDNFKEFFENILFEQAVMTGAGAIMKPLLDEITASLEDDYLLDEKETKDIQRISKEQMGKLNSFMENFYSMYPEIFDAASELSGLSAGIEGITENQADVISSYLNTIRFFVASIDTKTSELIALQNGATTQNDANPMLAQLQIVAQQTTAINELLSSLTAKHPTLSGKGLKVII